MSIEREKQLAAETAANLVEGGMIVGLGTGSTVAFLLPALARRSLGILCAATSPRTEHAARELGLKIEDFASIDRFDITIDGADQIAPDGWLVKGGGGAHTREKVIAAAADRFVVIADSSKPVEALHGPVPLELLCYGLRATMRRIAPVSDDHDAVQKAVDAARERFGDHVSAARSQPYYADVTHPHANKGCVVRYLSRTYDIPPEQIATIGDMPNDVLMFAHSGLSIAMGNASHEVQRAARRVTTTNEDEGFANAVERFILPDSDAA